MFTARYGLGLRFKGLRPKQDVHVRRINRPEFATIHLHLGTERTTEPPKYRRTATERPGCPVGYNDVFSPVSLFCLLKLYFKHCMGKVRHNL